MMRQLLYNVVQRAVLGDFSSWPGAASGAAICSITSHHYESDEREQRKLTITCTSSATLKMTLTIRHSRGGSNEGERRAETERATPRARLRAEP